MSRLLMIGVLFLVVAPLSTVAAEVEPAIWAYAKKAGRSQEIVIIRLKEVEPAKLKQVVLETIDSGVGYDGKRYRTTHTFTGYYSIEHEGDETLVTCRFHQWLTKNTSGRNKGERRRDVNRLITLHFPRDPSDECEVFFASDETTLMSDWPMDEKRKFQRYVPKNP